MLHDDFIDNPVLDMKNLGNTSFGEGDYTTALECYNKALALAPPPEIAGVVFGNISLTLLKMGKLTESLDAADKGAELSERNARLQMRRSMALHEMGRYQAALDALWKAQELSPYDVSIDLAVVEERKFVYTMTHLMGEEHRAVVIPMAKETALYTQINGEPLRFTSASLPAVLRPSSQLERRDESSSRPDSPISRAASPTVSRGHAASPGAEGPAWRGEVGNGSLLVLSCRVDRGMGPGEHAFVYIASPLDWQVLEEEGRMGRYRGPTMGLSSMMGEGATGNLYNAKKLRDELAKLPWASSFSGQLRLVREFQPVAVALLLRRCASHPGS